MKKITFALMLAIVLMTGMPAVVFGDTLSNTTTEPTSTTEAQTTSATTENTETTVMPASSVNQPATSDQPAGSTNTPVSSNQQSAPISQPAASPAPVSTPTPMPVPAPVQTQPVTSTPPSQSTAAPIADPQIPDILDVRAISMQEFEAKVMNKAASIVAFVRRVSTPYMMVALSIAALLLVIPGASPMRKRVGWSGIVTVLAAYLLVWWGPVLLGVIRGFAQ